ncbi:hypothetical protein U1Q18_052561 [Sarracenia purpurea var. burkii]
MFLLLHKPGHLSSHQGKFIFILTLRNIFFFFLLLNGGLECNGLPLLQFFILLDVKLMSEEGTHENLERQSIEVFGLLDSSHFRLPLLGKRPENLLDQFYIWKHSTKCF